MNKLRRKLPFSNGDDSIIKGEMLMDKIDPYFFPFRKVLYYYTFPRSPTRI